MSCCNSNKKGCCSSGGGCCKTKQNQISQDEYNELKEYLEEEIKDYKLVDYIDDNNKHCVCVEVEFEEYVLELENVDKDNVTLDNIIDIIIRNHMK